VIALVSRLLITVGDVAWGLLALLGIRKPPPEEATPPSSPAPGQETDALSTGKGP
jgi:hypothetical protein